MRDFDLNRPLGNGITLLEASAGTGKTYTLERLVAGLVDRESNPLDLSDILVVTFTNKAAREMRERIRGLLTQRAQDESRSRQSRDRIRRALASFDKASVYTIHGFCQQVLGRWPFESDAPFRQELEQGLGLEQETIRRWISSLRLSGMALESFRNFRDASQGTEGVIQRLARDLADEAIPAGAGVRPSLDEIQDARDIIRQFDHGHGAVRDSLDVLLAMEPTLDDIKEVFSTAEQPKNKRAPSLQACLDDLSRLFQVTDGQSLDQVLRKSSEGRGPSSHFREFLNCSLTAPTPLAEALRAFLAALGPLLDPNDPSAFLYRDFLALDFRLTALETLKPMIEERKDATGRWGFSDLIRRVAAKTTGSESDSPLADILRATYKAALIDEFQDTDPLQWDLFVSLFGRGDRPLVLIGDPKQSIYGFRGTGLTAYRSASSHVAEDLRFRLSTNWRSRPEFVEACNRFFAGVFSRSAEALRPLEFQGVQAGRVEGQRESLERLHWTGAAVNFLKGVDDLPIDQGFIQAVASEIRVLLDDVRGGSFSGVQGERRPVSAGDIAILCEKSKHEQVVLQALAELSIPAVLHRSRSVFEQNAASWMRKLLAALNEPSRIAHWRALLLCPLFDFPPSLLRWAEEAGFLDEFVEKGDVWRRILLENSVSSALDRFFSDSTMVSSWFDARGQEDESVYFSHPWPSRVLGQSDGGRHRTDWYHLVELLQAKQSNGSQSPEELLAWLDGMMAQNESVVEAQDHSVRLENDAAAVKVMTFHASKGLEFPLVFLVGGFGSRPNDQYVDAYVYTGADDRLMVDRLKSKAAQGLHWGYDWEERKRLWYVGMTRAIHRTWLPCPSQDKPCSVDSLVMGAFDTSDENPLPLHLRLTRKDQYKGFRDHFHKVISQVTDRFPELFALVEGRGAQSPLPKKENARAILASAPKDDLFLRDPKTSSFTSLVLASHYDDPTDDRDRDNADRGDGFPLEESTLPLAGDRGALFGTLVHSLFEEEDFQLASTQSEQEWWNDKNRDALYERLSRRSFPPDWYFSRARALKELVRQVLLADTEDLGRLCDVPREARRAETEFLLDVPLSSAFTVGDREFRLRRGFIKGFIDLLVLKKGRWWVVDWKTNVPPGVIHPSDYTQEALERCMDDHDYRLQYRLYLLALALTLASGRNRPVDWDSEIGGAAYCFVRGMAKDSNQGVFVDKPEKSEMMDLAMSLGLQEVIQ